MEGVSKGSAALEEKVVTSGELKGQGGRVGMVRREGAADVALLFHCSPPSRSEGAGHSAYHVYHLQRCTAVPGYVAKSCYKETVHCRHVAICCSTLLFPPLIMTSNAPEDR